jgi:site-specific recombinase XerD
MDSITNFNELMILKNFSKSTIKLYNSSIIQCSKSIKKEPENIDENDLRAYLLKNKHLSSSTKMSIINSFKTFYRLCFDRDFNHKILPRPKVEQKQPDILSIEEVQNMITKTTNLKHKAIICLMYSCALRVSEVVNLKIKDIDYKLDTDDCSDIYIKENPIYELVKDEFETWINEFADNETKEMYTGSFEEMYGGSYLSMRGAIIDGIELLLELETDEKKIKKYKLRIKILKEELSQSKNKLQEEIL